jgi:hypothetical protein
MILMPFKPLSKTIQRTCESVYKDSEYVDEFELLSLDIYEALICLSPSKRTDEEYFRLCQHASLHYLWSKRQPDKLFRLINFCFFHKFSAPVKVISTQAVEKAFKNGVTKL